MKFDNWLAVFKKLYEQLPDRSGLVCPNCGSVAINYQYVGDAATRIGFLALWCNKCLVGIQLSRVKAPECVELLSFDSTEEVFQVRLPKFRQVVPSAD